MLQAKLRNHVAAFAVTLLFIGAASSASYSGQPVIWETSSRAELLKGDARGVSISDTGMLMLAPNLTEVFNTEQAFVWSSAGDSQGNVYLGTGHDGKIYRVSPDGRGSLFYDAAELDVTALAIARDGSLYAGTSPDGKVYRIPSNGNAEVFFRLTNISGLWLCSRMDHSQLARAITASYIAFAQREQNPSLRS